MNSKIHLLVCTVLVLVIILINKVSAQTRSKTSRQTELLIKEKNSRNAIEQKIDSRLLRAIRESQSKKTHPLMNTEPVNVNADSKGNLEVDIDADVTDLLINKIKNLGGLIIHASKQYRTIKAAVNLSMIEKIAGCTQVKFVAPAAVAQLDSPLRPGTVQ